MRQKKQECKKDVMPALYGNTRALLPAWVWEPDAQYTDALFNSEKHCFFGGLECVGNSFAYVGDIRIRTQRAAVASRRATFLATNSLQLLYVEYT